MTQRLGIHHVVTKTNNFGLKGMVVVPALIRVLVWIKDHNLTSRCVTCGTIQVVRAEARNRLHGII